MNTDIKRRRFDLQNLWLMLGYAESFTQWQCIDIVHEENFMNVGGRS
jgi:hypothetical protein